MRKMKKIQAVVFACILTLLMSMVPATELNAANITIEYSQNLDHIISQLNNKLGIQSTADNWTFYAEARAELTCTSFIMYYNGKPMQMLSMLKPKYEGTDAYNIYNQYMADFTSQESGWKYCPVRGSRADIPEKTVDMGEVSYNIMTPMQFNGSSHTIVKYAGTLRYSSFLDSISAGAVVNMQCNGTTHSVRFVEKDESAAAPSVGGESTSAPESSNSNQPSGNGSSAGSYKPSAGSNLGSGTKIEIFDSAVNDPLESQGNPGTIIPGRTQISSEQILESTMNQVKPSVKDDKKPVEDSKNEDKQEDSEESEIDEIVMEEVMIESNEEPVFYIYEPEEMTVDQEGRANTVCTVSMTGIAGAGLVRLLMLFIKMKK